MIKTVFMGTPQFSIKALEYTHKKTDLKLIFTKEDKVNSRGNKVIFSPVKQYAIDNNIEYIQVKSIRNEEIYKILKEINPDLIVVAAYGKIIPKEIIDIPRLGVINVHSSILPKYRGASPIHYALMNGDKKTGISIMMIDEGLDTGDVLEVAETEITDEDNLETLTSKLAELSYDVLDVAVTKLINGEAIRTKQDNSKAIIVKPITKEQTQINWNKTNLEVHNLVRALYPNPVAYTKLNSDRIKICETKVINQEYEGKVGEVVALDKEGPIIKCSKGAVLIKRLQFPSKNIQTGKDVLNGRKILLGNILSYE